jgi:N-methylhydantoinase B
VVTKVELPLQADDRIRVFTAGGGGYGDPHARPAAEVLADVRSSYVSRQAAELDYGVVINEQLQIDDAATARLRRKA